MSELRIEAGTETESLLQAVLAEFDDTTLDTLEFEREQDRGDGLASEPITAAVVLTSLSTPLIITISRAVQKWLENRRQEKAMSLTLKAFDVSVEAGRALAELAKAHALISVTLNNKPPENLEKVGKLSQLWSRLTK
jgi:hypothetical protein